MTIQYGNNNVLSQAPMPGMMHQHNPLMHQQMMHQPMMAPMMHQPMQQMQPMQQGFYTQPHMVPTMSQPIANIASMGSTMMTAGLPCSADRYDSPPAQPNPNTPAFMSQVTTDPMMANYTHNVLYAIAMEIFSTAMQRRTVFRIFMYNLYSANNYSNPQFNELGALVMERVRLAVASNQVHSIEQAIASIVPDMVTIVAGANVRRYPELSRFVDTTTQREGMEAANKMDNLIRSMSAQGAGAMPNMHRRESTFSTDFSNAPYQSAQGGNTMARGTQPEPLQAPPLSAKASRYAAQLEQYQQVQQQEANVRASNNPIAYDTPAANAVMHFGASAPAQLPSQEEFERQVSMAKAAPSQLDTPDLGMQEQYNHIEPVAPVFDEPAPEPELRVYTPVRKPFNRSDMLPNLDILNRVNCTCVTENGISSYYFDINGLRYGVRTAAEYGEVVWKPSAIQPYHPAVNLSFQRLLYLILIQGDVIAIVQNLPKDTFHMDYDKHAVRAEFASKAPIVPATQKPVEKPQYIDMPVDEVTITTVEPSAEETSIDSAVLHSTVDAVVARATIAAEQDGTNETLNVIQSLVKIVEPVLFDSAADAQETGVVLSQLNTCKNFEDAARLLKTVTNKNVFNRANAIITERLNSAFAAELSIPDARIDSFVDDYQDILDLVAEHFPGAINDTLKAQQLRIMRMCLNCVVATNLREKAEELIGSEDDQLVEEVMAKMVFLTRNVSVNNVAIYDHELNVLFDENNKTVAVLQSQQPVLFAILEKIFAVKEIKSGTFFANYLLTKDGIRYSISRGMLMGSAYLITKV